MYNYIIRCGSYYLSNPVVKDRPELTDKIEEAIHLTAYDEAVILSDRIIKTGFTATIGVAIRGVNE